MQTHDLKPKHPRTKNQRIGRGGKRGTTAGRGTKGQKARAGHRMRPELRDIIKKMPKQRGRGKNANKSIQTKPLTINLAMLENNFASGDAVNPKALLLKGVVSTEHGRLPMIKILSNGKITKKLAVSGCLVSAQAKEAIEKAGGYVSVGE